MTARPAAPHRSHSLSLRGPRHLAECLGFLRARSRDPPLVLRLDACVRPRCVSTDLCHPNQTTASTHASCAPSFFSEACASRLLGGSGTLRIPRARARGRASNGLGPFDAAWPGNPRFTTRTSLRRTGLSRPRGVVGTRARGSIEPLTPLSPPPPACGANRASPRTRAAKIVSAGGTVKCGRRSRSEVPSVGKDCVQLRLATDPFRRRRLSMPC